MASAAIDLALQRVRELETEDVSTDPWKEVDSKLPDIKVHEKIYKIPREPPPPPSTPPLRLAKATANFGTPPKAIIDVILSIDQQKVWDVQTVAQQARLVEDGEISFVYLPLKTLSASTTKRDLVVARKVFEEDGKFFVIATSVPHPNVPNYNDHVRADHVLSGFVIKPISEHQTQVTLYHCLDFTGWIHDKFVDADMVKCANRLQKIRTAAAAKAH
eukprot:TRINITY_DN4657_c0_g2_i1.p1 TRINITY_DN4657_c0_g2~~TRINITY_DN4657_c0_g2_i1.p1  ORF type:complete len:217 (+),score=51.08 TRINITY_DN4657_c0_g2_i1:15-665(+)